jgi:hypothetical protein
MCRYAAHAYKRHYACFACRKAFKRRNKLDVDSSLDEHPARCPQCGLLMANMGLDFAPPKMSDAKGWTAAAALFEVGETFHSCGCSGPGYRPRDPRQLASFFTERLTEYRDQLNRVQRESPAPVTGELERRNAIAAWRARIEKLEGALRNMPESH